MDDERIIDLYFARDESAIRETADKYGARLRAIAYAILEDRESAEECENDVYLEAWKRIPPNEPRGYLFEYLGRITRHLAIDECRRRNALKRQIVYCELTKEMENAAQQPDEKASPEAAKIAAAAKNAAEESFSPEEVYKPGPDHPAYYETDGGMELDWRYKKGSV